MLFSNIEKIAPIISALCDHHKMDHDMLVNENISYLVSEWLIRNYPMVDFPWYLTTKESQNQFLRDNVNTMTICILRHQPNALGDFAAVMGENIEALMKVILIISFFCIFYSKVKILINNLSEPFSIERPLNGL